MRKVNMLDADVTQENVFILPTSKRYGKREAARLWSERTRVLRFVFTLPPLYDPTCTVGDTHDQQHGFYGFRSNVTKLAMQMYKDDAPMRGVVNAAVIFHRFLPISMMAAKKENDSRIRTLFDALKWAGVLNATQSAQAEYSVAFSQLYNTRGDNCLVTLYATPTE